MNKFQTGWRENQEPTTTLKDLKESVEQFNQPFAGMIETNRLSEEETDEIIDEKIKAEVYDDLIDDAKEVYAD
jgi:hypothetical protein